MPYISTTHKVGGELIAVREYPANSGILAVFVHGGGSSNQHILETICRYLQQKGYACLSSDFSGHGDSSSHQLSSIDTKTKQLQTVLGLYNGRYDTFAIFAFSMGAQIALNVVHSFAKIRHLVFFSPALYDKKSFTLPFNNEFTQCITVKNSWKNNNASEQFARYQGGFCLIVSDVDEVIPSGVFADYKKYANSCDELILKRAPHALGLWFSQDISRFDVVYSFLKSCGVLS